MPFIIPGQDVAAVPDTQSPWYEPDITILVAGIAGTGVLTGCAVTAQGTPDMTVAVASGTIQPSAGVAEVVVTGANKTITTAHATLPRIDLVSASAAGVLTVTDGTPALVVPGVSGPKPPALPSGHIALAMVDVPAADTTIATAQITDKRAMVFASTGVADILDLPTAEDDDTLVLAPDGIGGVEWRAEAGGGGSDLVQVATGAGSVVIPGLKGSPDAVPGSPSAFDDEFDALAGWTTLGTLDTLNVTDVPSHLHMQRAIGTWDVSGIYKACPSTPFTVTMKLNAMLFAADYQHVAIMLAEASPGKLALWGPQRDGTIVGYLAWNLWTNRTSRSSFGPYGVQNTYVPAFHYRYLRLIVNSSSSVDLYMSTDGFIYWPLALAQDPGFTIGNVGIAMTGQNNAVAGEAFVDWIRFA